RAVVDADQRPAGLEREFLDLNDFLAVDLAEAAAEHRRVLAEDADLAAVDGAVTGHHTVTQRTLFLHTEVGAAMPGQRIEFDERVLVQESQDPLTCSQLALGVCLFD